MNELYQSNKKTLYKIAHKWETTAKQYNMDFEDVLSLCHIYFMESYQIYDKSKQANFNTFLTTVISRNISKYFRSLKAQKRKPDELISIDKCCNDTEDKDVDLHGVLQSSTDVLDDICYEDFLKEVLQVADTIKRGKQVLLMRMDGYTVKEISVFFDVNIKVISCVLQRLRKKLKQQKIL